MITFLASSPRPHVASSSNIFRSLENASAAVSTTEGKSFSKLLEGIRKDSFSELLTLRQSITAHHKPELKDLMYLQMRAGELQLQVELVSKIADGMLGVFRRLQTQ